MRLAHTNATQQLADWRVVLMHDGTPLADCSNADYCLVKLKNAYDAGDGSPALDSDSPLISRELPDGTRVKGVTFDADCSGGDPDATVPRAVAGPSPRGPSSSIRTGR